MPGHSPGHQLIVTPDGVCFLGDVIMSENKLAFAKMPFRRETKRSMESIERLSSLPYDCYVAAHKGVLNKEEMERSARKNLEKEEVLLSVGRGLVKEPVALEQLELAYMSAADVTNPAIQAKDYMHISTSARIEELARRGFLTIRDGIVFPSSDS
jgi:glyoxylase-like metal-dependent hydrolase (beta-lactamase superfamily II)